MFLVLFLKRDPVCSPKPSLQQILVWFFTETGSKTVPVLSLKPFVIDLGCFRVTLCFICFFLSLCPVSLCSFAICLQPHAIPLLVSDSQAFQTFSSCPTFQLFELCLLRALCTNCSLRWLIICLRPLAFGAEMYLYKIWQFRLVG